MSSKDVQAIRDAALAFAAVSCGLAATYVAFTSNATAKPANGPVQVYVNSNSPPPAADAATPPATPAAEVKPSSEKAWDLKKQYYSSATNMWTDMDDKTAEESSKAFVVQIRGDESEEELPSTKIILRSEPVRQVLREVIKECEDLSDFKPTVRRVYRLNMVAQMRAVRGRAPLPQLGRARSARRAQEEAAGRSRIWEIGHRGSHIR
jgi:hypothetical protein